MLDTGRTLPTPATAPREILWLDFSAARASARALAHPQSEARLGIAATGIGGHGEVAKFVGRAPPEEVLGSKPSGAAQRGARPPLGGRAPRRRHHFLRVTWSTVLPSLVR